MPYPSPRTPEARPPFSATEKAFVRRFGTKALVVQYSGKEDMVGLRIVGKHTGLEIEKNTRTGSRYFRILEVIGTDVWRTKRTLPLKFLTSEHDLVPGIRSWIR